MASSDVQSEKGNAELLRFSDLVEVNPPVDCSHLECADAVSFIPMSDVSNNGQWTIRQSRSYGEVQSGYSAFSEGDVLFAKITPCTENGKGCHAVNLINGIGFGSTEFHILRAKHGVNSRLVYHLSVAPDVRLQAAAIMGGSAGQQRVPTDFVKLLRVSRKCLQQQDEYADLLDAMESAIERTRAVIDQTRKLKTALLQDLFTNGLPGRHEKYKRDRWMGRYPATWALLPLSEVVDPDRKISYGIVQAGPHIEDGVPYIRVSDMANRQLTLKGMLRTTKAIAHSYRRSAVRPGDIVFALRGDLGAVHLVPDVLDGANLTQGTARLSASDRINANYLMWALRSEAVGRLFDRDSKGSTFKEIALKDLDHIQVPVPHGEEQQEIAAALNAVESRIWATEDELNGLVKLKSALSQALLTGRVRVPTKGGE